MMSAGLLLQAIGPYRDCFVITPDENDDLAISTRAIRCNEAGSLTVNMIGGEKNVVVRFLAGETRHLCVSRVISANGVTNIEGMS